MKQFLILHVGFQPESTETRAARNHWLAVLGDRLVDRGRFPNGRELSEAGQRDLPLAQHSITGFTLIRADSLEEAATIAEGCPLVASNRVYEIQR